MTYQEKLEGTGPVKLQQPLKMFSKVLNPAAIAER